MSRPWKLRAIHSQARTSAQGKLAEAEVLIKCGYCNHFKYPLADVCIEVGVRGLQHVWQLLGDYQCQQS